MIYHFFFTMMHFVVDAFLRWTHKQRVQCVQAQQFDLEHRDHQGLIMPFSGQFDFLLREGRGNFGNLYCFKIQVLAPGGRYVDKVRLLQNLRTILLFMKVQLRSTVLKLLSQFSDGLLLIWR